jgi:hypothetical protein
VPADHYALTIGRWWRQSVIEINGDDVNLPFEFWRKLPANHQSSFQAGRQAISLG